LQIKPNIADTGTISQSVKERAKEIQMEIIVAIATIVGTIAGVIAIIPVLRQWREKRPTTEEILTERLRVLAVISAPVLGSVGDVPPAMRLDIWREWQNLADAIKAPHPDGRGKPIALTRLMPPTSDRLRRALAGCDVLHFCGHGTASGLLLETEYGREDTVSSEDFAALFAGSKVKLVVLSACESNHTAKVLRKAGVPAVIATRERVSDDVAHRFASHFYAELTDGKPFAAALKTAQSAIARQYGTEAAQNFTLLVKVKSRLKMPAKPAECPLVDLGEPECIGLPTHLGMVNRGAELVGISERLNKPAPGWSASTGSAASAKVISLPKPRIATPGDFPMASSGCGSQGKHSSLPTSADISVISSTSRRKDCQRNSSDIRRSWLSARANASSLHNMGLLEMERGQLRQALDYFRRSRDLFAQIGLEKDVADEEKWIAEVQWRMA